jgi:adenine-specific DNA-methyltransferase
MARATKTTAKDIESLKHREARRKHIPTTGLETLVSEDERAPKTIRWKRNTDLDPQLVWRGKDEQNAEDLMVDSVPIYIQEKIKPEKIISDLRRRSEAIRRERAENEKYAVPDLYGDFNGLAEPGSEFDFYKHDKNWSNRMILGDALLVMTSVAEKEALKGQVQCVYIDPPYGIRFNSNWQPSTKSRDVKESQAEGLTREPEMIRAFRDTWKDGTHSYLSYLRDRLTAARDLLADSGSIFVQIGDENVHHVRELMDEIFGRVNFVSLIPFQTTSLQTARAIGSVADFLLWYCKDSEQLKYHQLSTPKDPRATGGWGLNYLEELNGVRRPLKTDERQARRLLPGGARLYRLDNLMSQGATPSGTVQFEFNGKIYQPGNRSHWKTTPKGMTALVKAQRVQEALNSIQYVRFFNDFSVQPLTNVWTDTTQAGFVDSKLYVVQTLASVVERCIRMTTDPGDLVLDPTCGSGTTAYLAEQWGRRWITIDTSRVALALPASG